MSKKVISKRVNYFIRLNSNDTTRRKSSFYIDVCASINYFIFFILLSLNMILFYTPLLSLLQRRISYNTGQRRSAVCTSTAWQWLTDLHVEVRSFSGGGRRKVLVYSRSCVKQFIPLLIIVQHASCSRCH